MKNIVIVGADPTGMCLAYELQSSGYSVTLIEPSEYLGGLFGKEIDGMQNTEGLSERSLSWIRKMSHSGYRHSAPADAVTIDSHAHYKYPLACGSLFLDLPISDMVIAAGSKLKRHLFPLTVTRVEHKLRNEFGDHLYGKFFKYRIEKLWGKKSLRGEMYHGTSECERSPWYLGIKENHFWENVGKAFEKLGGTVVRSAELLDISATNLGKITSLTYKIGNIENSLVPDHLVNTLPLDVITRKLGGSVYLESTAQCPYRSLVHIVVEVCEERLLRKESVLYVHDKDFDISKAYLYPENQTDTPKGTRLLGVDYYCSKDDNIWQRTEGLWSIYVAEDLLRLNIAYNSDVNLRKIVRVERAIPFGHGATLRSNTLKRFINTFENLISIGRDGSYKPMGVEECIHDALEASHHLKQLTVVNTGESKKAGAV